MSTFVNDIKPGNMIIALSLIYRAIINKVNTETTLWPPTNMIPKTTFL